MKPAADRRLSRIVGCGLALLGAPVLWLGLIRLGWLRHGASPLDFGFLHPAWWSDLGAHPAHRDNLTVAGLGLGLLALGLALLVRSLRAPRRDPGSPPSSGSSPTRIDEI